MTSRHGGPGGSSSDGRSASAQKRSKEEPCHHYGNWQHHRKCMPGMKLATSERRLRLIHNVAPPPTSRHTTARICSHASGAFSKELGGPRGPPSPCLLYTSDAADER